MVGVNLRVEAPLSRQTSITFRDVSSHSCKAPSLHFSTVAPFFISSHQLGFSLIELESAHIRSSANWRGDITNLRRSGEPSPLTILGRSFNPSVASYLVGVASSSSESSEIWKGCSNPPFGSWTSSPGPGWLHLVLGFMAGSAWLSIHPLS